MKTSKNQFKLMGILSISLIVFTLLSFTISSHEKAKPDLKSPHFVSVYKNSDNKIISGKCGDGVAKEMQKSDVKKNSEAKCGNDKNTQTKKKVSKVKKCGEGKCGDDSTKKKKKEKAEKKCGAAKCGK